MSIRQKVKSKNIPIPPKILRSPRPIGSGAFFRTLGKRVILLKQHETFDSVAAVPIHADHVDSAGLIVRAPVKPVRARLVFIVDNTGNPAAKHIV